MSDLVTLSFCDVPSLTSDTQRTRLSTRLYTGANMRMPPVSREDLLEEITQPVDAPDGTPYLCLQTDLDTVRQHPGLTHRLFVS